MKTKNFFLLVLCTLLSVHIKAANGDTFTANTSEGDIISFKIISEVDKTVQVGTGTGVCGNPQGSVTIPETVTYSGVDYSVISIGAWAFNYTGVRKVTIPNSIASIGTMAFNNCVFLTAITIPNSVTSIGQNAFSQCSDLSSVTSEIETPFAFNTGAFSGISSSCKLTIPYGKKSAYIAAGWTESVFKGGIMEAESVSPNITFEDDNVKSLCVANWDTNGDGELSKEEAAAVTDLGTVFKGNMDITSFDELQYFTGLTSIGSSAFRDCSGLTSVAIPNSVTSIGSTAFAGCSSLTFVNIPNSVTSISSAAFYECRGLTSVTIPNSVTSIDYRAFKYCSGLTSITIGSSVTTIGSEAFYGCSNLKSVTIPSSVTTIGSSAFQGCIWLTSFTIGSSVTSMGSAVFQGCSKLSSVVSEIEEPFVLGSAVFSGGLSSSCILTVPAGTVDAYTSAGWTSSVFKGGVKEVGGKIVQSLSLASLPNMTYGATSYTLPATTKEGLTLTWTSNNSQVATISGKILSVRGAGTAIITASQMGNDTYQAFAKDYTLTVSKAPLTITAKSYSIKQGTTIPTFEATYSGFKNNETASVLTKQPTFSCSATSSSATGTYPITVSGAEAANYSMTYVAGTLTITEKTDQSMSLTSLPSMTYGASNYTLPANTAQGLTLTWTSSNINVATISGNTLTVKGAGTATITATQAGNSNYKPFSKTFTLTVSKATLTVTANSYTIQQGSALPTYGVTFSGFKNGDTKSVLTKQPTITCSATTTSAPGSYSIKASGATAANYNFSYVNGTLTITEKPSQSMSLVSLPSMTYGAANYTLPTQTTQGLTLTWVSSNTSVATISGNTLTVKGAGTAAITASQAGNEEYKPFSKEFALTVAKAPLTITAQDFTRYEGEENPAFTVSYEGFVKNEDATVLTAQPVIATTATAESAAGTYPITVSGATAANYDITFVAGTLTVQAKSTQTIALTSLPDMTYGGDAYTLPAQTEEGFDLTWASSNANVATISSNTLTVKGAGTATITASQVGNEEYKPFSKGFTLTVAKAPLTITVNDATKNVGEENPAFTASYEGFVGDDDASVLTAQPTFTTEADENSPVGTYAIVVSGAEAANYEISYVDGTLTVVDEWSMNNTLSLTDVQVLRGRQIVLPVNMSNTEDITAIQFDLTLPAGVSIAKNTKGKYIVEKTERCADHTLSASKPGEANMYKVLLYSTEVESITGNEGAVINVTLEAAEDMEAGDYEVSLSNINLTTTAEKKITPADVTCVLTVRNSIPGDANGDSSIDVTDIVAIANSILGHASESFDDVAADVNGDGSVDVTDIVVVANIILHDGGANAAKVREAMQMLDPQ